MVLAYDEVEEQLRKLRLGMTVLDEKARSIMLILTDPLLDPSRWQEPEAAHALKRALKLLVHDLILREKAPGEFHVEVQLYEIRQSLLHESAWESNPPAKLVTPPTRFEDEGSHRATSALEKILFMRQPSVKDEKCCSGGVRGSVASGRAARP